MSRPRKSIPTPRCHKGSSVVDIYDGGKRRTVTLGPWNSPEAEREYARLIGERRVSHGGARPDITVNEVCVAFLRHAVGHYVRVDGSATHEVDEYRLTIRYVASLYSHVPAREFGPLALKTLRQKFIDAGWCRSIVNRRVNRVRHLFKWAVAEELVPPSIREALSAVAGLQRGRSKVREAVPVEPVAVERVEAVLPFLRPEVAAMVQVQLLSGMRPGEVCTLRPAEIDRSGPVWLYRPTQHKTGWRGKSRVIVIGPKAQEILEPFTPSDGSDYYFSPRRAVDRLHAERAANRITPRYPSHMDRNASKRVAEPLRSPAEHYDGVSYGHAIARACDRAFLPPSPLAQLKGETQDEWQARLSDEQLASLKAWRKRNRWHPNQLRHSHATTVRKRYGLEAAQVALGHSRADVTQVYAERDLSLAEKVAGEIG